jgi:hypothetical protein
MMACYDGMFADESYANSSNVLDAYSELRATCVHEAGHAVLTYVLGFGCSRISVYADIVPSAASQVATN